MTSAYPENQAEFSLTEILSATGARVVQVGAEQIGGVGTDTRLDLRGKLFVALAGERFDGQDHLDEAVEAGARCLLVGRTPDRPVLGKVSVVQVPDTLVALGALAALHRARWGKTLVAVAGSVGKTTTRSAISSVLSARYGQAVHSTRGNLNNRIGVPLTLFGLEAHHEVAVVEIGTNQIGEIAMLAAMVQPDLAVLTRVALEHTEFLGDLAAIEAEEGALFAALGAEAIALANGDDERARRLLQACQATTQVTYGSFPGADFRLCERKLRGIGETIQSDLVLERPTAAIRSVTQRSATQRSATQRSATERRVAAGSFGASDSRPSRKSKVEREQIRLPNPLMGEAGALAVTAAVAVTDLLAGFPTPGEVIEKALGETRPGEVGRLSVTELVDGTLVIDDSYNSSPASVRASLQAAREVADLREARLMVVMGEMRELGAISHQQHQSIGQELGKFRLSALIAVSGEAEEVVKAVREEQSRGGQSQGSGSAFPVAVTYVERAADALLIALDWVQAGDVVLVKGSRGVALERVVQGLVQARGGLAG